MEHHHLQEGVAGREGEGVVGDGRPGPASLHRDVLVVAHVVQHHVVRVEVETSQPPDQQDSQGVRQVNNRVGAGLVSDWSTSMSRFCNLML